jgi:hypothetical protein
VHDGDVVRELALEDGIKILRAAQADERVRVRQLREDADLVRALELDACRTVVFFGGVREARAVRARRNSQRASIVDARVPISLRSVVYMMRGEEI